MADGFVSVSRRIGAPADRLFALLTDRFRPWCASHRAGDAFVMSMHHERFGDYQMR
jgi:hypothetical protein